MVAVKQKRSSPRAKAGLDNEAALGRDQHLVVEPRAWPAVEAAPRLEAERAEIQQTAEKPGAPDCLLTKIGTPILVASLIFDGDWYRREYPDVAAASMDPVKHYFDNGSREGRNPNRYFDTNWYASNNPDVAAAGLNPFLHYLLYGALEGREPAP